MDPEVEQLLQTYREMYPTLSEREKAVMERRIHTAARLARLAPSHGPKLRNWILEHTRDFGVRTTDLMNRSALLLLDNNTLWDRADKNMSLNAAASISRDAREHAALKGGDPSAIVTELLAKYDSPDNTFSVILPSGKISRRKRLKPPISLRLSPNGDEVEVYAGDSKKLLAVLQNSFEDYLSSQLPASSIERELIAKEYTFQIRAVYDALRRDVRNRRVAARRAHKGEKRVSLEALKNAMATLEIPMPEEGERVDMNAVKARYRKLASRFHPDHSNSKDADILQKLRDQLNAVIKAYEIAKKYVRQFEGYHD